MPEWNWEEDKGRHLLAPYSSFKFINLLMRCVCVVSDFDFVLRYFDTPQCTVEQRYINCSIVPVKP